MLNNLRLLESQHLLLEENLPWVNKVLQKTINIRSITCNEQINLL